MTCLYPKIVKNNANNFVGITKCGKCIVCREARIKAWYLRLLCEMSYTDQNYCLTLTYDNESLPWRGNLRHYDVQCYLKRLRKKVEGTISYYVAGEYGEGSGRAHYHLLIFFKGDDDKFLQKCIDEWPFGHVYKDMMNPKAIRYTLDYLQKDMSRHAEAKVKPYQKMSKGLGLDYLLQNEKQIASKTYIEVKGIRYAVPEYFRKKSELVDSSIREAYNELLDENQLLRENFLNKRKSDYIKKAEQTRENILARKRIKRGSL